MGSKRGRRVRFAVSILWSTVRTSLKPSPFVVPHRSTAGGWVRSLSEARELHYSIKAAPSTLAATLLKTKILWPYIGIASLDESNVRACIEANTKRDNFYLQAEDEQLLGKLETYMKGILGPVLEGGTE
jgi:hypothetical protein